MRCWIGTVSHKTKQERIDAWLKKEGKRLYHTYGPSVRQQAFIEQYKKAAADNA